MCLSIRTAPRLHERSQNSAANPAVQQQLNAAQSSLDLPDLGYGAHHVKGLRVHRINILDLGHRKNQSILGFQGGLNRAKRPRTHRTDRSRDAREQHEIPQW